MYPTNVVSFYNEMSSLADEGSCEYYLIDFRKAFCIVSHKGLHREADNLVEGQANSVVI